MSLLLICAALDLLTIRQALPVSRGCALQSRASRKRFKNSNRHSHCRPAAALASARDAQLHRLCMAHADTPHSQPPCLAPGCDKSVAAWRSLHRASLHRDKSWETEQPRHGPDPGPDQASSRIHILQTSVFRMARSFQSGEDGRDSPGRCLPALCRTATGWQAEVLPAAPCPPAKVMLLLICSLCVHGVAFPPLLRLTSLLQTGAFHLEQLNLLQTSRLMRQVR